MPQIESNPINIVLVVAAVTFFTRIMPFLFFDSNKNAPGSVIYLGKIVPPAIMAMLLIYSLRNVAPLKYPYGLPELIALSTVILLHLWKKNNLVSILSGTVLYMFLVQKIFS
ncbi:MAG: branched-chain amino acid transporter AzlD [Peptococcaceae bacterium]|nr:branched-chain amino acid transporter AzlD [Peptococcaceae bacterium]